MKALVYIVLVVGLVVAAIGVFVFEHTFVLPRSALQEFQVIDPTNERPATVSVGGRLIGGMLAVSDVLQIKRPNSIMIIVKAGITRPGRRKTRFHCDVPITNDVDEISFGVPNEIIWHRKK